MKSQRFVAVFILGFLLLNYPLLSLFNRRVLVGGFPLLYLYLFLVWAVLIGLIAIVVRTSDR
jgi:hypothetical protein